MRKIVVAICFLLIGSAVALSPRDFFDYVGHKEYLSIQASVPKNFTQRQEWFSGQLLDHFNIEDTRTFRQRYWVIDQFWDRKNGPVILYICGEYTCPGLPSDRLFPLYLAQQHSALILVLEHRFYGLSQPFDDLSTEHLRYLTVDQALDDLAYFIQWANKNETLNLGSERRWITYGGSYPGALSAWFRYKYPHLTSGAVASSAVINAIVDYSDYDHQLYLSTLKSGKQCPQRIQELNKYVEEQLYSTNESAAHDFKQSYGAENLTNEQFLNYYVDSFAGLVQYGKRTHLCDVIVGGSAFQERYDNMKKFVTENNDPAGYMVSTVKNDSFWDSRDSGRQWTWQTCSELGWFQSAHPNPDEALRSSRVDVNFFLNFCKEIFGDDVTPDVQLANLKRGGMALDVSNLIMVNGCEDPWKWASRTSDYKQVRGYVAECDNCAHCVELYTPSHNDSWNLWWTRVKINYHVGRWFGSGFLATAI